MLARVSRGMGALSLNASVQVIAQIAVVPAALYAWGKVRYGEWIVITGLVTFLRLTDLGLQTYVVNRLCASYARSERETLERDLHNALRAQIPLVVAITLLAAITLATLPVAQMLRVQTLTSTAFNVVAMLIAVELLLGVPMGIVAGVYRATGRLARAALVGTFQQAVLTVLTISLILFNASFVSLATARVVVGIIVSVWIVSDLRRLYPWLRIWKGEGDWRDGVRMMGPGIFFILFPLADFFSTQFTILVLQQSADGGQVSLLATHRTVANIAVMASGLLTNAVWPELTALHARGEFEQLRKTHRSLARMNMWIVGMIVIGTFPFIPHIFPLWTARELSIDTLTLLVLLLRVVIWGLWSASLTMLCAVNKQKTVALIVVGAAALTSLSSLWLIPIAGIRGAALAQLVGDLAFSSWLIPLVAIKQTRDRLANYLRETAPVAAIGLVIPAFAGLIGWTLITSTGLKFGLLVPLVISSAAALMWFQLAPYERSALFHSIGRPFTR